MGKSYESIEECLADLERDLAESMSKGGYFDNKAKEIFVETAEESYGWYSPENPDASRYRSGRGGSFADETSNISDVKKTGNGVEYEIRSTRNPDIWDYMEEGVAGYGHVTPKPIMDTAESKLEEQAEDIIISDLNGKGW